MKNTLKMGLIIATLFCATLLSGNYSFADDTVATTQQPATSEVITGSAHYTEPQHLVSSGETYLPEHAISNQTIEKDVNIATATLIAAMLGFIARFRKQILVYK